MLQILNQSSNIEPECNFDRNYFLKLKLSSFTSLTDIYLNNKNGGYEESYSFPMHGASQVRTLDANGDGFDDLLVGAYFAEDERNRLMLLLHDGNPSDLAYIPHRITEANLGRWMVINKGDVDGDGDVDAVIGSFVISKQSSSIVKEEDKTNLLILLNKSK